MDLAAEGHTTRSLATQFAVTEWTIMRWMTRARRRQQLPYWRHMGNTAERNNG
jgi:transposase